jgi:hypothetical protein
MLGPPAKESIAALVSIWPSGKGLMMGLVKRKAIQLVEPGVRGQKQEGNKLVADLEDDEAAVRRQAIRDITYSPDAAATLVSRVTREGDVAVRELILNTLIRLNDPSAIGGLVDCLRSEDAALRNEVIETFKRMGKEVEPILQSLLDDPDPDVRIFVLNCFDSEQHADVESWLIKVIELDLQVNVCATAVDLLCELGTEAAIDPLVQLKERFTFQPYIQFAADLALKRIREV